MSSFFLVAMALASIYEDEDDSLIFVQTLVMRSESLSGDEEGTVYF